jgi:hypothetical protein
VQKILIDFCLITGQRLKQAYVSHFRLTLTSDIPGICCLAPN